MAGKRGKRESPIVSMEIVDRPLSIRDKWLLDAEVREILKTIDTGKAVRLSIATQEDLHKVHMALRYAVNRKAKKHLHYKSVDDETILAWAEKEKSR